jgi:endonuclease III
LILAGTAPHPRNLTGRPWPWLQRVPDSAKRTAAVLEKLRESFYTQALLEAVAKIDQVCHRIGVVRAKLSRLHGMAHDLIDDAGFAGEISDDDETI